MLASLPEGRLVALWSAGRADTDAAILPLELRGAVLSSASPGGFTSEALPETTLDGADATRPRLTVSEGKVFVAEREGFRTIFTIDRKDFALYRPSHLRRFELVPA
jgi:hypothetical protein